MSEKIFLLPESIRQATINYLASRPYSEVAQGIDALLKLKEVEAKDKDEQES